ncbi:MAG: DUF2795 domain-containing protein [Dehalococcoidia bacterium]
MQSRATREDYDRALAGLEYPVSKAAVVRNARDHGGLDTEVAALLDQLPDHTFDSLSDLVAAIRALYDQRGGAGSSPI